MNMYIIYICIIYILCIYIIYIIVLENVSAKVSWPIWMEIEVLPYEVPYIISYAELCEKYISGIINAKSSSVWSIFSIFSPAI